MKLLKIVQLMQVNPCTQKEYGQEIFQSGWNIVTSEKPLIIKAKQVINKTALSPDDRYLASAGHAGYQIKIWDPITGKQLGDDMYGHKDWISSINYSKCGNYIISGSRDRTIRQWNAQTQEQVNQLNGHDDQIMEAQFTQDLKYIVSCSWDRTIRFWDPKEGTEFIYKRVQHDIGIWSLSISPSLSKIAFGDDYGRITIWNYERDQKSRQMFQGRDLIRQLRYSADGRSLLAQIQDNKIEIWDIISTKLIRSNADIRGVQAANFSPDMRYVISGSYDGAVHLFDRLTGKRIGDPCTQQKDSVYIAAQFSVDGKYIISGDRQGQIRITLAPKEMCQK